MNVWDYVTGDDVHMLSDEEYESFRNYLRLMGHRIETMFGIRKCITDDPMMALTLDSDTDLYWGSTRAATERGGNRISLEEVKRMASLGMLV